MPIVRLEGVNKHYGSVTALSTIDLHVHEGEFLTLLGPSGSGKTTILNLIAGMVRPSTGRIFLRDIDVTDLPASQRQLGMVFQNYALMPHMTIFENVAFPLRVRRVPGAEIRKTGDGSSRHCTVTQRGGTQAQRAVGRPAAACRDSACHGL